MFPGCSTTCTIAARRQLHGGARNAGGIADGIGNGHEHCTWGRDRSSRAPGSRLAALLPNCGKMERGHAAKMMRTMPDGRSSALSKKNIFIVN